MVNVETLYDLFVYELQGIRRLEVEIADVSSALASKSGIDSLDDYTGSEFRDAARGLFEEFGRSSEQRVERLDDAFDTLDHLATSDGSQSPVMSSFDEETEQFNNVVLNDALRNPFYVDTAIKIMQLVVRSYERALAVAEHLDIDRDALEAIESNHGDTEELLEKAEDLAESPELESLFEQLAEASPQN